MTLASQVDNEYTAIVTHWRANCPVIESRRCYTDLGGPPFNRPQVPTFTSLTRASVLAGVVWVSLSIIGVRGSARPQGISPTSQGHRLGLVSQSVHFPLGFGLDFVLPIVDDAREVFHRQTLTLSAGHLYFRDSDQPVRGDLPEQAESGWGHFNVVTPYWVRETN